jgi:hypothetical protein
MNRKHLSTALLLITIISCQTNTEKQAINKVVYNASLKDTFFLMDMWSYPSFTVKDSEGKFDFTNGVEDTSHLKHTANIIYAFDSTSDNETDFRNTDVWQRIHYGEALLVGKSMLLSFNELTASSYHDLTIKIKNRQFSTVYKAGSPAGGNRYYDFEKETLTLQKESYSVGDTLRGYLDFKTTNPHYAHLKGAFKVKIKGTK